MSSSPSHELKYLWDYFKSLHTEVFDAKNTVIDLQHEMPFIGDQLKGQKLFVRKCYIDLERIVRDKLDRSARKHFIIQGTPGIGKSYFGLFLLSKLIKEGKTVHYHSKGGYYIFSDGEQRELLVPSNSYHVHLRKAPPGTWYIVDGLEPIFANNVVTLLITSPKKSIWHSFYKYFGCTPIYQMPIWSLEELQLCRQLAYSELDADQVNINYDMWGGSSRYVLRPPTESCDDKVQMERVIASSDIDKCVAAIGDADATENVSHLLLHIDTDESYIKSHMVPASSYVFKLLACKLFDKMRNKVILFLSGGAYSTSGDPTATFRGHLYEGVMHKYLMSGGKFKTRSLGENGKESEIFLPPAKRKENFKQLTLPLEQNVYYQPYSSCFPTIDSLFCFSTDEVILFQVTIADNHPILHQQLKTIVEHLQSYRIQGIYFVVPEDKFPYYKSQDYINKDRTITQRVDRRVREIEQHALCISLDDPAMSKQKKPKTN